MCAVQKYFINEGLVADTAMLGLGMCPSQRYGVDTHMDISVFSETFRGPATHRALHM